MDECILNIFRNHFIVWEKIVEKLNIKCLIVIK